MSEINYPYIEQDGTCEYNPSKIAVTPTDCESLKVDEDGLAQKLQQIAPLSIGKLAINYIYVYQMNGHDIVLTY